MIVRVEGELADHLNTTTALLDLRVAIKLDDIKREETKFQNDLMGQFISIFFQRVASCHSQNVWLSGDVVVKGRHRT